MKIDRNELLIFVHNNWNRGVDEIVARAERHFGRPCREAVRTMITDLMVVR